MHGNERQLDVGKIGDSFATFKVDVADIVDLGKTAIGNRRMVPIVGGEVSGQIGHGKVLSGTDWQWIHEDGTISLDAQYTLLLDSGELIEVESRGLRNVDASGVTYFRTVIRMVTETTRPDINRRLYLAFASRLANQVILELHPLL